MAEASFEPVTLEILWQRLITVADQMATTLMRTAFSNTIAAAGDFGCVIMDASGRCVVHANRSLPIFNRTMPHATRAALRKFGSEGIRPGDVLITNDPWINAGHQPDVAVMTPIFHGAQLSGFAASIAHHSDVGGALDSNRVREVYEEGLIIPLSHLYEEGRLNEGLVDFITANVRMPRMFMGDIDAQVAANQTGVENCRALLLEYALDDLPALAAEIQGRAETATRAAIRALPDGEYTSRVFVDEFDRRLNIDCCLRVQDDTLEVDFEGTSPQQPRGGINVTLTFAIGQASYALKCLLLPDVPGNAGCYRPIHITAPAGSVLNAQRPVSVRQRHRVGAHIFGAVQAALADVLPERVIAGSGLLVTTRVFGRPRDGQTLHLSYAFNAGGMGARQAGDGISTIQVPALASSVPVELFELAVPLVVTQKTFLTDSGGAGRHRGGLSQRMEFRLLPGFDGTATVSIYAAGQNVPPFGLYGGAAATPAEVRVDGRALPRAERLSRAGALQLEDTTTVVGFDTAAGGGYGPPAERDPVSVLKDVRDELVSAEAAAQDYGVVMKDEMLALDEKATQARRAAK